MTWAPSSQDWIGLRDSSILPASQAVGAVAIIGIMFTPEERERLRDTLVMHAHADERVAGAAVTGSAAVGQEDRWSDIDLALGVASDSALDQVIAEWTGRMYDEHGAVDHVDVIWEATVFGSSCSAALCRSTSRSGRWRSSARPGRRFGCLSERPANGLRRQDLRRRR